MTPHKPERIALMNIKMNLLDLCYSTVGNISLFVKPFYYKHDMI